MTSYGGLVTAARSLTRPATYRSPRNGATTSPPPAATPGTGAASDGMILGGHAEDGTGARQMADGTEATGVEQQRGARRDAVG